MKVQGVSRDTLPWKSPWQPYTAWFGCVGSTIITLVAGFSVFLKGEWSATDFVSTYIGIPIFIVPIIVWKIVKRTKVRVCQSDLSISNALPTHAFLPVCSIEEHRSLVGAVSRA